MAMISCAVVSAGADANVRDAGKPAFNAAPLDA